MPITANAAYLNSFTNTIANETLQLLTSNFIISQLVRTPANLGGQAFTRGNTVDFLIDPVFSVTDGRVDDTERTYQRPTQNKISLTLDYFREVPASYTTLDEVIANPAITIDQYPRTTALALAADIEKTLFSIALNDSAVPAGNEIGGDNVAMNAKALREIRKKFAEFGVPASEDIFVVVTPAQYTALLSDSTITEAQTIGASVPSAIATGRITKAYGLTIVESLYLPLNNNLPSVSGSNANPVGVAMTRSALVYGMRPLSNQTGGVGTASTVTQGGFSLRFRTWADPNVNQFKMTTDILYGAKVVGYPSLADGTVYYPVLPILGGVA
jgi:hypothetical protein